MITKQNNKVVKAFACFSEKRFLYFHIPTYQGNQVNWEMNCGNWVWQIGCLNRKYPLRD